MLSSRDKSLSSPKYSRRSSSGTFKKKLIRGKKKKREQKEKENLPDSDFVRMVDKAAPKPPFFIPPEGGGGGGGPKKRSHMSEKKKLKLKNNPSPSSFPFFPNLLLAVGVGQLGEGGVELTCGAQRVQKMTIDATICRFII